VSWRLAVAPGRARRAWCPRGRLAPRPAACAAGRRAGAALALSGGAGYVNGSPLARVKAGSFMHPLGANRTYDYLSRVVLREETSLH
jgi:hypothetical protein